MGMRLFELLEAKYSNWTFPSKQTMAADFAEYKKKEASKWEGRAEVIGARFPIFKDLRAFEQALKSAKVVAVTDAMDGQINNRSQTSSLADLKDLVSGYVRPRDVDRIVGGFKNNDAIPYPIILKGSQGIWIMAGNTRLDAAGIMGVPKKALLVDVSGQMNEDEYAMDTWSHGISAKNVAAFIKKNCKPWLKATKNGAIPVFRGFEQGRKGVQVFTKKVRPDRRPLHSSRTLHNLFMGLINVAGKTANRENTVAVTGNLRETGLYGEPFVVLPLGKFNYTWHVDFHDWAQDFISVYADSQDMKQQDIDVFEIRLPKIITRQWLDHKYEFLISGVRGDDGTLIEAIHDSAEIMIKTDSIIAIDIDFYKNEVLPLLQSTKQKIGEAVATHQVQAFADEVKAHYGLEDLWVSKIDDNTLYLMSIIVPKENRKQGIGSRVMQDLTRYADEQGMRMILSPATKDKHHGTTSHDRLVQFYKQFGFKQNKGRNKDFRVSASMIRDPQ